MNIKELFLKPIDRPINGVIKADQMDAASVWQELEEYVVTKQISDYLARAELRLQNGSLLEPPQDNADYLFRQVLALDERTPNLHGLLQVLAEALAVKAPQRHVPIAVLRVLLKIPGAQRLLRTDAESLDFIQTTRFDTAATQALARKHQLTWPDLPAALQVTARYVAGQLRG